MSYNSKYKSREIEVLLDKVASGNTGGGSSGSGAYSEVNHGTSDTTFTLTPNTFHVWDEVASLTLDFGSEISGVANEYLFQFTSGATATSLTLPDDIKWANDAAPTIAENMIYQVSILKGLASVLEFKSASALIDNKITITPNGMMAYLITLQYASASELKITYSDSNGNKTATISAGVSQQSVASPGPGTESSVIITTIMPPADTTYNYIW